jgi:aspartate carbamoyltransferase catalytic subunit
MATINNLTFTSDLDRAWVEEVLFPRCDSLADRRQAGTELSGRALYCLFYEPSFITRASFERAMGLLGGECYLTENASQSFPVTTPNYIDNVVGILQSLRIDAVVIRSSESGVMAKAASAGVLPVVNGGGALDHPTQALADLYTLKRELGRVDGLHVAVVGRLEHRNVNALLTGLSMFDGVTVTALPFSGGIDPEVARLCAERGVQIKTAEDPGEVTSADVVYLNAPRTVAHAQLLGTRGAPALTIDAEFMAKLKSEAIVMNPMQRSGDFAIVAGDDHRLAYYRQSEYALVARMAVLAELLA